MEQLSLRKMINFPSLPALKTDRIVQFHSESTDVQLVFTTPKNREPLYTGQAFLFFFSKAGMNTNMS